MKAVSIIRDRGQLTIPDSIRQVVSWVTPLSAITISVVKPDEIVIRPHRQNIDWDKIWADIKRARSLHGKGQKNALEFIQEDRFSH